jgi:lysozyme
MVRSICEAGLDLIEKWEQFRANPYWDAIGKKWTQGYGETLGVAEDSDPVTQQQAEENLLKRLTYFGNLVESYIETDLTDNQYAALVSLVYNTGPLPLTEHLGYYLNQGNYQAAANQFLLWDHAQGQVIQGLLNRRNDERALFLTPDATA